MAKLRKARGNTGLVPYGNKGGWSRRGKKTKFRFSGYKKDKTFN